jgi:hypothetical protein
MLAMGRVTTLGAMVVQQGSDEFTKLLHLAPQSFHLMLKLAVLFGASEVATMTFQSAPVSAKERLGMHVSYEGFVLGLYHIGLHG